MCGIIGYLSKGKRKNISSILIDSLKKLEYRGYDSWGLAIDTPEGFDIKKRVGEIGKFSDEIESNSVMGLGHTRWATHGEVNEDNSHPHSSCSEDIVVVHNGIIENYGELKKELEKEGHQFSSSTDTEIISHLIEKYVDSGLDFKEATVKAVKGLEGSYAIAAMHKDYDYLIATRKGSPLVVGVGEDEYFISSDIPAFLEHTRDVIYLSDNDFVTIENDIEIIDSKSGDLVNRPIDTIEWDVEQAAKGDFEHFMLKEISEQVDTVKKSIQQDRSKIEYFTRSIKDAKGIFFVACGTSYNACLAASYVFSKVAEEHVNVVLASEFPNYEHFLTDETLVIAVSQSGETADVLDSVKTAKKKGSKVLSLVNVMGSTLTRESDEYLTLNAGPEIGVASTKAYTSQLALLTLLVYDLVEEYEEGRNKLEFAWNEIYNLTSRTMREKIDTLANDLKDRDNMFLIGRGLQYSTALEAALKIKEISYIHAEAFAGGELKHGTIALIEDGTPCIVFVSENNEKEIISNAMEVKSRGGYIIGVSPNDSDVFDFWIKVPEMNGENPIVQIIPMQILAYQLAVLRGNNPDKPRNLAKSVTVR